jgi:hypothetical protein
LGRLRRNRLSFLFALGATGIYLWFKIHQERVIGGMLSPPGSATDDDSHPAAHGVVTTRLSDLRLAGSF